MSLSCEKHVADTDHNSGEIKCKKEAIMLASCGTARRCVSSCDGRSSEFSTVGVGDAMLLAPRPNVGHMSAPSRARSGTTLGALDTKAPMTEQQGETCEEEQEQKYIDLEKEVKEAEPGKNTMNAAGEATETRAEAVRQETKAEETEGWTASEASAASAAAADGKTIAKRHAAAPEGTVASEAQETNEKD